LWRYPTILPSTSDGGSSKADSDGSAYTIPNKPLGVVHHSRVVLDADRREDAAAMK